ncbi:DUF1819 family protein [Paenibacillus sp. WQ 127069]|uniref:DUF1819 family protein n=1 Tax=Paenibacillus baimaensis TaxID=2982185 RepID=A0ABT2UQ97_9BACL|nr:DUF1819 family protein [Paenibacillus sp. WQ 127069]MCU6796833.1 DUF1819 family protein [Paenibacillus sp. WQ 127069]
MKKREYSAGSVKQSFWFSEFRKVVSLINKGKTLNEIKELNIEENLFAAPTQERAIQIFNTVSRRVKSLDQSIYQLFEQSDVSTQKIIAIIAIMKTDSLFFDFIYEVYREKLIIGSDELVGSDIRIFFKDKQLQSEKVASWTDYTLRRLGTCYKTMLMEAGLTDRASGNRKILKPILDKSLEQYLNENGMEMMIHALTGVR